MSKLSKISRRDFLNGLPIAIGVGATPLSVLGCGGEAPVDVIDAATAVPSGPYPPALTGMRGSHPGSFEVAHQLSWAGRKWARPDEQTDGDYDLVVVGGGLSGLAAAYFYRERFGQDARILVLDNHDDFGGHAKRNEFTIDGRTVIGYGGSQTIEAPGSYSDIAAKTIREIGIDTDKFYQYYDQSFFSDRDLLEHVYFDAESYGEDRLVPQLDPVFGEEPDIDSVRSSLAQFPLSQESRNSLERLVIDPEDYLDGRSLEEKFEIMRSTSYEVFVQTYAGLTEEAALFLRRKFVGIWAMGWDALSALEGYRLGMPGMQALGLGEGADGPVGEEEPYIFHFPDGNASVARLFVRSLIPGSIPGSTMEDVVTARANYGLLDQDGAAVRIRLSSTAVDVRNTEDGSVDVVYVSEGEAHRVRAKNVVMACYSSVTPYLCPQMPETQRKAIEYAEKTPLVYTNIALRNWRAFENAGTYRIFCPGSFFHSITLDFPVSMGDYFYPSSSDEPMIATMHHAPISPGLGLTMKEQSRIGRQKLYGLTFDDFEQEIIKQLTGALGPYGFDAERDIAGITVNRWPHGYAYEYNELEDDPSFGASKGPHIEGRAMIGRIAMANSDSQATAYVDAAIDAAYRAVNELSML
ncbi:MAG: FAD/NAD(P)-binding protein [Pseudomonadota bacterium]